MSKKDLAATLRRQQYFIGLVPKKYIDRITDDDLINCYLTSGNSKEIKIHPIQLNQAIRKAQDVNQFFLICDVLSQQHLAN